MMEAGFYFAISKLGVMLVVTWDTVIAISILLFVLWLARSLYRRAQRPSINPGD